MLNPNNVKYQLSQLNQIRAFNSFNFWKEGHFCLPVEILVQNKIQIYNNKKYLYLYISKFPGIRKILHIIKIQQVKVYKPLKANP